MIGLFRTAIRTLSLFVFLCSVPLVHANFSYYYTGGTFTDFSMGPFSYSRIDAVVTFAAPLGPNAVAEDRINPDFGAVVPLWWDMTNKSSGFVINDLELRTDGNGDISSWVLLTETLDQQTVFTSTTASFSGDRDFSNLACGKGPCQYAIGPNGVWTSDTVAPEPYMLFPVGLGFLVLIYLKRGQRKQA